MRERKRKKMSQNPIISSHRMEDDRLLINLLSSGHLPKVQGFVLQFLAMEERARNCYLDSSSCVLQAGEKDTRVRKEESRKTN